MVFENPFYFIEMHTGIENIYLRTKRMGIVNRNSNCLRSIRDNYL